MTDGDWVKGIELEFDTSVFNLPRSIRGTAIINATGGFKFDSANTVSIKFEVTLIVVDKDDAETVLGTAYSGTYSAGSNNAWQASNFTVPIELSRRNIKKGEKLKLKLGLWGTTASSAASVDLGIGHSPFNLDGTVANGSNAADYNQIIMNIPFEIDL